MILFTDGGSTKCDWILMDDSGEIVLQTQTEGLNPAVVHEDELTRRIKVNNELANHIESVDQLDFYGAGCGTATPAAALKKVLESIFTNALVTVNEDTVAAVHAVTKAPGMVCILGTGSNCCYFDGKSVHQRVASLGYSVMDEASGNYFGKRLLSDYFFKKMPESLRVQFENEFDLNPDVIKINLYQRPNPNAYLASFGKFVFGNEEADEYFTSLVTEGFNRFVERQLLFYEEARSLPVHFVGSIAYFSKDIIKNVLNTYNLELGNVVKRPVDGLITHYRTTKIQPS